MKYIAALFFFLLIAVNTLHAVPSFNEISDKLKDTDRRVIRESTAQVREAIELTRRETIPTQAMFDRAIELYNSAASVGHVGAMHNLAAHYQHGRGVPVDSELAFKWYLLASQLGFAGSQNNLGDMYENGSGTYKSLSDALYWYTQAALQGESIAYVSLGTLLMDTATEQRQFQEAAFWLFLAESKLPSNLNLIDTRAALSEILSRLSQTEIEEAQERARRYVPLRQTPASMAGREY